MIRGNFKVAFCQKRTTANLSVNMQKLRRLKNIIPFIVSGVLLHNTVSAELLSNNHPQILQFESGLVSKFKWGQDNPSRQTINARLDSYSVPGAAIAIIRNNKIVYVEGYGNRIEGKRTPINGQTVFSVGSVSKMINAALVIRLAAEGKLDLDADVNRYLKSWKVPENRYTRKTKVTLRHILSHSAGFSQHGFPDFQPGEQLPSALQTLNGLHPAKHGPVRLMFSPGTEMDYSGGGITVSQLVVEEVTQMSYQEAAKHYVFIPLKMHRSTFQNPLAPSHGNIAHAHDDDGEPTALPRGWESMPEVAASGLWTSAEDLARFVIALNKSAQGNNDFLPQSLAQDMMSRENNSWYGLGPRINGQGVTKVFHHGGANNSYRAWIEGHLTTGDGIISLTNGTNGHFVNMEIRKSAEEAFNWSIKSEGGLEEPNL